MDKHSGKRVSHDKPSPAHKQATLDEALEESFPASDPPAQTNPATTPTIDPKGLVKRASDARKDHAKKEK